MFKTAKEAREYARLAKKHNAETVEATRITAVLPLCSGYKWDVTVGFQSDNDYYNFADESTPNVGKEPVKFYISPLLRHLNEGGE
jgi:hypothetical protein